MKTPLITYINGAWLLSWLFYALGDAVSKFLWVDLPERFYPYGAIYKVYNWLMRVSIKIQDATECAGPWGKEIEQ